MKEKLTDALRRVLDSFAGSKNYPQPAPVPVRVNR